MREQAGTHWVTESVPSPISLDDERVEESCEVSFHRSPANDEYTTKQPVGNAVAERIVLLLRPPVVAKDLWRGVT
jgi:hypothetical protein